jgi:DNA polymerase-3 subunit gamma/tau
MGQALYRKYRPKSLAEIVGQEHVTTTLANALKAGRVSHAYLLTGPRGVGKTSIARILAHEINGLSYGDEAHLDIIEIDAASNRRIDEIRDLRDRVNTAPSAAKYKVYIIDEVHMLTKEAFNALLKTLEEPPAHVVFILATTEAHKLPETIISRTQRYSLRPVPQEQVIAHLRTIAGGEKLQIDDDALGLIAQHGEGSFRDSISLLDQASSTAEHITRADVERILGLAPDEQIGSLLAAVTSGDSGAIVTTLADIYAQGYEPAMVAHQLGGRLRQTVLDGQAADPQATLALLKRLLDVPGARSPKQLLELVLLQSALPAGPAAGTATPPTPPVAAAAAAPPATSSPIPAPAASTPRPAPAPVKEPPKTPAAQPESGKTISNIFGGAELLQ